MSDAVLRYAGFTDREIHQTFDNFDCADDPRKAAVVATCQTFQKGRWLVLLGTFGAGKDHLASAVVRGLVDRGEHCKVISGTAQKLMREYRDMAFGGERHNERAAFEKLAHIGCLVIRDAGVKAMSESERGIWIEVLDYRYNEKKTTIITGNVAPDKFSEVLDQRITDRLFEIGHRHNGTPIVLCDWPSYRRQPTHEL